MITSLIIIKILLVETPLLDLYIAPSHLKLVARAELPFPKSELRVEELNNLISKSVNAYPHHKQYRTDRILIQVSNANLVVSQRGICSW